MGCTVLVWLSVCSEVQAACTCTQLMPLHPQTTSSLASFKSRLVLPFWYHRLTQVVHEKKPSNGCSSSNVVVVGLITNSRAVTQQMGAVPPGRGTRGRKTASPKYSTLTPISQQNSIFLLTVMGKKAKSQLI